MTERSYEKRPEEIEDEIARTRADMDSTLDAIQRKLSPAELVDQALGYLRENGGDEMMRNVGNMVRENPIPVALIGAGLAWFMYSAARRPGNDDERFDRGPQAGLGQGAYGTAYAPADEAGPGEGRAGRVAGYARARWERTRDGYGSMVARHPLLLGATALAAGAAIGLALPSSRREDETLGAYRDELLDQAQAAGREQVEKVQRVAEEAWRSAKRTAKDTANREGLAQQASVEREQAAAPAPVV